MEQLKNYAGVCGEKFMAKDGFVYTCDFMQFTHKVVHKHINHTMNQIEGGHQSTL